MGARFSAFRLAVRRIFSESLPGAVLGKRTSRVISQQLDQAMRVMSVALIAQGGRRRASHRVALECRDRMRSLSPGALW